MKGRQNGYDHLMTSRNAFKDYKESKGFQVVLEIVFECDWKIRYSIFWLNYVPNVQNNFLGSVLIET